MPWFGGEWVGDDNDPQRYGENYIPPAPDKTNDPYGYAVWEWNKYHTQMKNPIIGMILRKNKVPAPISPAEWLKQNYFKQAALAPASAPAPTVSQTPVPVAPAQSAQSIADMLKPAADYVAPTPTTTATTETPTPEVPTVETITPEVPTVETITPAAPVSTPVDETPTPTPKPVAAWGQLDLPTPTMNNATSSMGEMNTPTPTAQTDSVTPDAAKAQSTDITMEPEYNPTDVLGTSKSTQAAPAPSAEAISAMPAPTATEISSYSLPDQLTDYGTDQLGLSSNMTPLQQMMSVSNQAPTSDQGRQLAALLLRQQLSRNGDLSWTQEPILQQYYNQLGLDLTNQNTLPDILTNKYRV